MIDDKIKIELRIYRDFRKTIRDYNINKLLYNNTRILDRIYIDSLKYLLSKLPSDNYIEDNIFDKNPDIDSVKFNLKTLSFIHHHRRSKKIVNELN